MNPDSNRKSLLIILSVALVIVSSTLLISIFARGYRLDTKNGNLKIKVTGLLSVTSKPKSASVYVDNLLVTATDDTLNLNPGSYQLKISKDGYFPWEKNIQIQPELVYQADAQLLRQNFEPKSLTQGKIFNLAISPDQSKVIFSFVSSPSAVSTQKSGLYLLELTELPLLMSKNTQRLLSLNSASLDWTKFTFQFSPNSKQILATSKTSSYLFTVDQTLNSSNLLDITSKISQIKKDWETSQKQITDNKLEKLPKELKALVSTSSSVLSFNNTEDKILYQALTSASLENLIISPPPFKSTQTQSRQLQKNFYYVYDLKEDTNFLIGDTSISQISWIPYSNSLVFSQDNQISVIEYDSTNHQTLYSDSENHTFLPTPDGYRLIITLSNQENPAKNLYLVTIKDR